MRAESPSGQVVGKGLWLQRQTHSSFFLHSQQRLQCHPETRGGPKGESSPTSFNLGTAFLDT